MKRFQGEFQRFCGDTVTLFTQKLQRRYGMEVDLSVQFDTCRKAFDAICAWETGN